MFATSYKELCIIPVIKCCILIVCCSYCAGTKPWGHPSEHLDFEPQRHDDGCIEVIGFTMTSLVSSQPYLMSSDISWNILITICTA